MLAWALYDKGSHIAPVAQHGESKTEGLQVPGQPGLHRETLSLRNRREERKKGESWSELNTLSQLWLFDKTGGHDGSFPAKQKAPRSRVLDWQFLDWITREAQGTEN